MVLPKSALPIAVATAAGAFGGSMLAIADSSQSGDEITPAIAVPLGFMGVATPLVIPFGMASNPATRNVASMGAAFGLGTGAAIAGYALMKSLSDRP